MRKGPKHLQKLISRMKYLVETRQKEVMESVEAPYHAHQENVLMSIINDDNPTMRELGFYLSSKARQ